MKIEQHVCYAIDDYQAGKLDSALMHACMAIDGTAKNLFSSGGNTIGLSSQW